MDEGAENFVSCARLHRLFNGLPRQGFPFDENLVPENGIYVLFEEGERAHDGLDRIVRVGTHTGQNNLRPRLAEHFLAKNKDRSIFRKNIGRALLKKRSDPFLSQWELDLTTAKARKEHAGQMDFTKLSEVEREVTEVICGAFTFCVFQVDEKGHRLELEEGIIAAINQCSGCGPSSNWLGAYSPKRQIRESGLWLVQGLNGQPIAMAEVERLEKRMMGAKNNVDEMGPSS